METTDLIKKTDLRFNNVSTLIVKVTRRCNLDCTYCYENIVKDGDMSIETFRNLALKVFTSSQKSNITFIFHGGEPTLISNSFYEKAFDYCLDLCNKFNKTVSFNLQTNLLFLNSEKIELFKKYRVSIGASLDSYMDDKESFRKGSNKFLRNFRFAKDNNLSVGVLSTINLSNYNNYNYFVSFLENDLKLNDFKANIVYSVGTGKFLPDIKPEMVFEAQKAILDNMIKNKGYGLVEENLSSQIHRYFTDSDMQQNSLCHSKTCGAGDKVVGITTEGDILPCGRFQWNDENYKLGSIKSEVNDFFQKVEVFHSKESQNWFNCESCDAKKICNFGCQAFISRSQSKANVECLPTKMLFKYFIENKQKLREVYEGLLDRKYIKIGAGYSDEKYGDYTKEPYNDTYSDKYSDNKYNDKYNDEKYSDTK